MILILLLAIAGLIDASYLTWEHFNQVIPPCTINRFLPILSDCGKVLQSQYASIFRVPVALIGAFYYFVLIFIIISSLMSTKKIFRYLIILQTMAGAVMSLYFMYLQLAVIRSICIYCTISALISFIIIFLVYKVIKKERYELHLKVYAFVYQNILKPFYFLFDPEFIHNRMVHGGSLMAKTPLIKLMGSKLIFKDKSLKQKIAGINFENPIGLAAGFDYNADLTQTLYYLDFGFQSIGTITNGEYAGNPPPLLGRLIKSRSLMVNKGFKNKGAKFISEKLKDLLFMIPVGVSIGMTNTQKIKSLNEAVRDIISAFKTFEKTGVKSSYYELNISCPNLVHAKTLSFYPNKNLEVLLTAVDRLRLKKPIFVKMPIDKSNRDIGLMLKTISKHKSIKGVIFGNLQKNRKDSSLVQSEVRKFKIGNFSGKPCEKRSNELIEFSYKNYGDRLIIIGCGGVFDGKDAYKKIKLGASLVQLITGMIYQGPQVISQINLELIDLIKKDGYKNIKEAVGASVNLRG